MEHDASAVVMAHDAIAVHHVPHDRAVALVRRTMLRFGVAFVGLEVAFAGFNLARSPGLRHWSAWAPLAVIVAVFALLFARLASRNARRLATYQLTLGPNVLRVVQADLVPTEVFRHDVTRIVEMRDGLRIDFGIRRTIGVPSALDGFDQVRARLAAWHSITPARQPSALVAIVVAGAGGLVGMLPAPRAVLTLGDVLLLSGYGYFAWRISRTSLSRRRKARTYVVAAAVMAWALWRLWAVWS